MEKLHKGSSWEIRVKKYAAANECKKQHKIQQYLMNSFTTIIQLFISHVKSV